MIMGNNNQNNPKISCINLGYYQVKASDNICFKSKADITIDDKNLAQGNVIEYNDKRYILEIGKPMLENDKTRSEITKIFVLNVLAQQAKTDKETFNVLITSPPIFFKRQSEELPSFLEGEHKIKYNNKPLTIIINKVVVLPETFLVYTVNNPSKLKDRKTLIIDVGGKTTNICLLTDCKFSLNDYITISRGMYHIDDNISDIINSKKYTNYDFEYIEILRQNNDAILYDEEVKDEIELEYRKHVNDIVTQINIKSWQIDEYSNILICGGGGMVLEQYIKEVYPHAMLSNNPMFDNLKALELMAKEVFK